MNQKRPKKKRQPWKDNIKKGSYRRLGQPLLTGRANGWYRTPPARLSDEL